MTKMEREQRAREWASRIEAFRVSGMTQRRWAAEQGLSEDRVSYWYRKLRRPPESLVEPTWVPLTATTPDVSSLRLRVGPVEIDVATGFDPLLALMLFVIGSTKMAVILVPRVPLTPLA